jgi:outer membrane protein OmpA-like peptidoglycan-associated protein
MRFKFSKKMLARFTLIASFLMSAAAFGVEPGFYLGASGGQTTVDKNATDFGYNGQYNIEFRDDDTGWKAYVGYNFLPWLGVEGGYVDFGGVSRNVFAEQINVDLTGWDAFIVGTLPVGPVDLFVKGGAIDLKSELDTTTMGSVNENETQFAYGAGIAYNYGHWSLRAEAEGFDDNEVDDFYFLSAGITYRFFSDKVAPVAATPVAAAPEKCADGDGDGVCDSVDQCPNTAPGTRVGSIGCDCDYTLQLQFAFDSAKLSAADMAQLDQLVPILTNEKAGFIGGVIEGHTDSIGSAEYNMGLSKRRAESAASYLQSKGVNMGSRFATEAFGETKPIASNDTDAGRAENRRVVIRRTDCDSSSK